MKILAFIISLSFFIPPQNGDHRLVVQVHNIKPLKGDLYLSLHQKSENFYNPDSAIAKKMIKVVAESVTVVFDKVPGGRLAVAIFHDENLNAVMDVNEIGFPREGYGFSTNPKGPGKPKFEQAAFDLNGNDTIDVKMVYHPVPPPKKDKK